ncbi:MAG: hypothetical protein AAGA50_29960 [Pseudomonadota bacterium]
MIGLIFVRGYPHSVLATEAKLHPSGLFQANEIERWASEKGETILGWVAIGEDKSRPLKPSNPGFQFALTLAHSNSCALVMDNVFRLYDGASIASAQVLTDYLQSNKFPVMSATHNRPVHLDAELFKLLLADRLCQATEKQQGAALRGEIQSKGLGVSPRLKPEVRQEHKNRLAKSERRRIGLNVAKVVQSLEDQQKPVGLDVLVRELNAKNMRTQTGKEWTITNLRKALKKIHSEAPNGTVWQHIKM